MVRHDELPDKTIAARGGFAFSRMGDGMAAAFATARDALEAATAIHPASLQRQIGQVTGGAIATGSRADRSRASASPTTAPASPAAVATSMSVLASTR